MSNCNRNTKEKGFFDFCVIFIVVTAVAGVSISATTAGAVKLDGIQDTTIITNIKFNTSDLSFHTFENYDIVKLKGCQLKRHIGEPALPMKSISLVMPPTAKITDIRVLSSENITIEGEYTILPAQPPAPTSTLTYPNETEFAAQKASVYSTSDMYPGEIFRYTGEGSLRGHKIVSITLFPVQYVPAEKRLIFYKDVTLCINYNLTPDGATAIAIATEKSEFTSIAKKTVSNPDDVDRFAFTYPTKKKHFSPSQKGFYGVSSNDIKYVIITNDAMKDAFQPLADWKTKKGVPAEIMTVSSIEANYSGIDTQERIRNFINDTRMNRSTEWVLLGGDTDVVPCRGAYGNVSGAAALAKYYVDYNIPADLYYSDLDGNWNADGDTIYGEVEDDVDLFPDVFVGRAPVNTIGEAQTFVNKTLTYEKNPPMDYELDMLFLAEKLWSNPVTWGGDTKNIIDSETIPPKYDPITKKYEKYGTASRQIAINEMNAGPHIVNHVGHGNFGGFSVNEWVSSGDAYSLSNSPKNFILYTISCMSNGFDQNSVSEYYMNNPNGGTVAYIGNSRYGFFIPGYPGWGPSDKYDQEFFNSLFNDNLYHIGETVADSKIAYIGQSQQDGNAMRWLQYAINLLGDPELPIWTDTPRNFTINKPSEITANITQEIVIHVLNDTPVQNATVCIMKSDNGIYNVSATDASGNVSFSISPTVGTLNVTVTKQNFIPNESTILVVPASSSALIISSPTHPDEDTWYCTRNATFNWTTPSEPSGIACYSYTLDNLSTTIPDEICNTTGNTYTSYTDLAYGIWYFHVRAKNDDGYWGPAGHYRVMIENCDDYDGCYVYGNGCEDRDFYCSGGSCEYTYSNRHTDYYDDWEYYCKGEAVWKHKFFHDFYCDGGSCVNHTSWKDDQLVENCTDNDGWEDTGDTRWVSYPGNECKEKEQKEQEYLNYTCSDGSCDYSVTETRWIDTGNESNKPDETICGCTASNTLKECHEGTCSDTGICNATTCGAGVTCDGKKLGESCGTGKKCNSTCNCILAPNISVSITSPENKTYASACVRLNFTVEPEWTALDWMGYSLDGGANMTITGNTTIEITAPCDHTLTLYVKDEVDDAGNSSEISFTLYPGNIAGDENVNVFDLQRLAWAFNSQPEYPNWMENADLNCDNKVNVCDLQILAWNFMNDYTAIC